MHRSLRELALAFGTDKEGPHSYTAAYERHLERLRDRPVRLLEIGVGGYADPEAGGESLRMWREYFPLGEILGMDIYDKSALAQDGITILRGDQSDEVFLGHIAQEHGPFDVVIDDGSHLSAHVIASFRALFPHLKDDGLYVIEDLQTSYWDTYVASTGSPRTSMGLLKDLIDGLNHAEFDVVNYRPTYFDLWVSSVSIYHNIAFIEKGPNLEGSNILPPHPRTTRFHARPSWPARAKAWLNARRRPQ